MGKPGESHVSSPASESIGSEEPTGRTETSKYPQEKKSNEIPPVAASERGRAQTVVSATGLQGPDGALSRPHGKSSGSGLERPAGEGESPVCERLHQRMIRKPEYGGTRGIPSESGGTTLQG